MGNNLSDVSASTVSTRVKTPARVPGVAVGDSDSCQSELYYLNYALTVKVKLDYLCHLDYMLECQRGRLASMLVQRLFILD